MKKAIETQKEKREYPKSAVSSAWNVAFELIETFILCTCFIIVLFAVGIRVCNVDGSSMNTTLTNGDLVVISDIAYTPKQDDIVVFHLTNEYYNKPLVKRVIATEGQWIDIKKDGNSLIITLYDKDDTNFSDPIIYEDEYAYYSSLDRDWTGYHEYPVQVPEGHVFVLGDNRWDSSDSRSERVSFVDVRCIFGKVVARVKPFDKFTLFTND